MLWPDKPLDYAQIADDAARQRFGAFRGDVLQAVISCCDGAEARFRKFATRPDCQQGLGSALLRHAFMIAGQSGARRIWGGAQLDSVGFYTRSGMQPEGEPFFKGAIPCVRLAKTLP